MPKTKQSDGTMEEWEYAPEAFQELSALTPLSDDLSLHEQAERLEELLPHLIRWFYALSPDHPTNEMPVAQLRICSLLLYGPRNLSSLSEELGITVSAITQLADRLEKAGLVMRTVGSHDKRTRMLQLSEKGVQLMKERRDLRIKRVEAALARLPQARRRALLHSLQTLLRSLPGPGWYTPGPSFYARSSRTRG